MKYKYGLKPIATASNLIKSINNKKKKMLYKFSRTEHRLMSKLVSKLEKAYINKKDLFYIKGREIIIIPRNYMPGLWENMVEYLESIGYGFIIISNNVDFPMPDSPYMQ